MTKDTRSKTFVVVGAGGRVGRVVASTLINPGHQVRPAVCSLGVPLEGKERLDEAFSGKKPMSMIAAKDIGARAVEILVAPQIGPRVQELHGARDYTMEVKASSMAGGWVPAWTPFLHKSSHDF